jgi:predicted nucleotidyltransferase
MNFGIAHHDWTILSTIVLQPLWKSGAKLYVFGSRAKGGHQPFSDIDLLIDDSQCSPNFAEILSQVQEAIEESRFPIKVDFVLLRQLAKSYHDSVLSSRIEIVPHEPEGRSGHFKNS